jgi:hypothetical protein
LAGVGLATVERYVAAYRDGGLTGLWRFLKRRSIYGRYHPTFADFKAAIEDSIAGLSTTHADQLASLRTLNFQQVENVSLLAA